MLPKTKIYITLGVLLVLLPVLGFPHKWETAFEVVAGLAIIFLSIWTTIDRRMTQRAKAQKRQAAKLAQDRAQAEQAQVEN